MPTSSDYYKFAKIALASAAGPLHPGVAANREAYVAEGMNEAQARVFNDTWYVLAQADLGDGFRATLFEQACPEGERSGELVLGIRGTEASHWGIDAYVDILNISLLESRLGMPQYWAFLNFYSQLVASGTLSDTERITLAGHCLGGFIAQAFAATHDSVVKATYTYNTPGFFAVPAGTDILKSLLDFFGISAPCVPNPAVFNVRAVEGDASEGVLGKMIGHVRPVGVHGRDVAESHSILAVMDALGVHAVVLNSEVGATTNEKSTPSSKQ